MHYQLLMLQSLKKHNFRGCICDDVIFVNRENIFVAITISTTNPANFTTSITAKNLLSGEEACIKDICIETLENNAFLNSGILASMINEITKCELDNGFVFRIIIRNIRKSLHLTQKQFTEKINTPVSTYRKWEQGVTIPSQAVIKFVINKFFRTED